MPVSKRRKLNRRSPSDPSPFLVKLHYVNRPLSIDYGRFKTEQAARQFCIMWVGDCALANDPSLEQRAEIYRDRVRVAEFTALSSNRGMGA